MVIKKLNMKHSIITLMMFFLSCINIGAQNTLKGKVLYKYSVNDKDIGKTKNQVFLNKFKNSLKKSSDKISYQLLFNNNESSYKIVKYLVSENDIFFTYAALITGGAEEFYLNKERKERLKKVEFIGEKFIVKSMVNDKWILTQTTKNIGDYTCYKAILDQTNKQQKNKIKLPEITAWYCPKTPLMFGPKGYGNLPGLILALRIGPINYVASKIELNSMEEIVIKKPKEGNLITEEEFNNLLVKIDKR